MATRRIRRLDEYPTWKVGRVLQDKTDRQVLSAHLSVCVGVGVGVCRQPAGYNVQCKCMGQVPPMHRVAAGAFARDRDPPGASAAARLVGERANGLAECVHGGEEPPRMPTECVLLRV
jgi:hypothetical protein